MQKKVLRRLSPFHYSDNLSLVSNDPKNIRSNQIPNFNEIDT